jgi:hypothetical protein
VEKKVGWTVVFRPLPIFGIPFSSKMLAPRSCRLSRRNSLDWRSAGKAEAHHNQQHPPGNLYGNRSAPFFLMLRSKRNRNYVVAADYPFATGMCPPSRSRPE